jgi:hypothetical protein
MLGRGRSPENATQESASGRHLQLSAHASADPMFGIGNARAIVAGSIAGLLVAGWFLLPYQLASQENAVASARVSEQSAPIPAPPALVRAKPGTDDEDATQPDQLSTNVIDTDRAAVTEGHPETDVTQTAAGGGTADVTRDVGRADRAEATATPSPETAQSGVPTDDVTGSHEEMFRRFTQWEAARFSAQAASRPAERIHNPQLHLVRLAPTGSLPQARPGRRPDRPNSVSGLEPAGAPADLRMDPRRAVHNSAVRPASGQSIIP